MNWKRIFLIIGIAIVIFGGGWIMFNAVNQKAVSQEYSVGKFNRVHVDIPTGDVSFKTGNKYRISYTGLKKVAPKVRVEKENLYITFSKQVVNLNVFNLKSVKSKIIIEMPKEELEDINIDNANGNFSADCLAAKTGKIDLANGSVSIKKLKIQQGISFATAKGNINIEESNASGYDLSTSLGKITVNGKRKGDYFENNSETDNVLEADTSLGSISVN